MSYIVNTVQYMKNLCMQHGLNMQWTPLLKNPKLDNWGEFKYMVHVFSDSKVDKQTLNIISNNSPSSSLDGSMRTQTFAHDSWFMNQNLIYCIENLHDKSDQSSKFVEYYIFAQIGLLAVENGRKRLKK